MPKRYHMPTFTGAARFQEYLVPHGDPRTNLEIYSDKESERIIEVIPTRALRDFVEENAWVDDVIDWRDVSTASRAVLERAAKSLVGKLQGLFPAPCRYKDVDVTNPVYRRAFCCEDEVIE